MSLGFLACVAQVMAQEPDIADKEKDKAGDSAGPARFWQATLEGGHFMVALDRIASVSRHKYVLDGGLIIDEVTVDTVGQALARFYVISPVTDATAESSVTGIVNRGKELIDAAGERAGTNVHNMVMKKYPVTSHAKSIEYRVMKEADLTALYNSVRTSWENGKGRKFTISK